MLRTKFTDPKNKQKKIAYADDKPFLDSLTTSGYVYADEPIPGDDNFYPITNRDTLAVNKFLVRDPNYKPPGVDYIPNPLGSPQIQRSGTIIQHSKILPLSGGERIANIGFDRNTAVKRTKFSRSK
jgi:hypothetical protein